MVQIPNTVKKFVAVVKKKMKPKLIILFGSRARGNARLDSDYDLLIVAEVFEGLAPHSRAVLIYKLHKGEFPLEIICLTPKEFEEKKRFPSIVREAVKEAVVLAEA